MKLVVYKGNLRAVLGDLLQKYSNEVVNDGTRVSVDRFVASHNGYIYLLVHKGKYIGFTSYSVSDNCGLSKDKLINSFAYVLPEHRKSKAFYLIMVQTGKIVEETGLDVQIPTGNEELINMAKARFKAKLVYNVFEYSRTDALVVYDGLKNKIY